MNNKERYQQAFSALHASRDFLTEVQPMTSKTHTTLRRGAVLCAAVILLFAMATVCYAADVGGIQRILQVWIRGEQVNARLDIQNGSYTLTDENGNFLQGGGGVSFGDDGSEQPLSDSQILEHLESPEVRYYDDGTVFLYYRDQAVELTDRFDDDGVCYLKLQNLYFTVKYHGGFATSPETYVQPGSFNTEPPTSEVYLYPATEK